jgi:hypothetical protein
MNEPKDKADIAGRDGSGQAREAEPWHAADEKRPSGKAPIGTHSLTGGGANVGMPAKPSADAGAERSSERTPDADAPAKPDPLAEPRANVGEILGRKP